MFNRDIIQNLRKWALSDTRKPLILRGARQVGKTTAVDLFSKEFDHYIYVNLERPGESDYFRRNLQVRAGTMRKYAASPPPVATHVQGPIDQ